MALRAAVALVVLVGCGGGTGGSAGAGGPGGAGGTGGSGGTGVPGCDGGLPDAGYVAAAPVRCGPISPQPTSCQPGQVCCRSASSYACQPGPACCPEVSITCARTADCRSGQHCCWINSAQPQSATVCQTQSCDWLLQDAVSAQLCESDADCLNLGVQPPLPCKVSTGLGGDYLICRR